MNLIKMTWTIPFEKINPLIEKGQISDTAIVLPFGEPERYKKYTNFDTVTHIPVLDKKYKSTGYINFNHIGYLSVSEQYYKSAKELIKNFPQYYLVSVAKAFYAFFKPCSDSTILKGNNRERITGWVNIYVYYLLGGFLKEIWHTTYTNRINQTDVISLNLLYIFIPLIYLWAIILFWKGSL